MNQKIICDLDLGAHGLRIVDRPISNFLPLDDRSFLKVGGGQTKREVAKFSARDADRLDDYQTRLAAAADILRSSGPCHVHGGLAVPRYSGYRFPPEIIQQAI